MIVTGAAGGIGRALVSRFAAAGYSVIATDLHLERPEGLTCEAYVACDLARLVGDPDYAAGRMNALRAGFAGRPLAALINNAALQIVGATESLTRDDWQRTLGVNLQAPFLLVQTFLPELEDAGGAVVNVSSVHARLTKPGFVAYATSKAALSGMTRAMAVDLGGRVRVNAIEPAAIATPMLEAGFTDPDRQLQPVRDCHPQQRIGTPEEVAELALMLCNGRTRFLHGACVALDGGISARLHDPV